MIKQQKPISHTFAPLFLNLNLAPGQRRVVMAVSIQYVDVDRGRALVEERVLNDDAAGGTIVFPFDDMPIVKLKLPECIYSSVMLLIHGARAEEYGSLGFNCFMSCMVVAPQVLLLAINVVVQVSFIRYLERTLSDVDSCNIKTDVVLRYLSVASFVAGMIFEFFECFEMLLWTVYVKTEDRHQALQVQIREDGSKMQVSGLTICQKMVFLVLVIGTKTAIAVYLSAVGAQFVLLSETHADLILNCLAMVFVIEIDDVIYHGFTPAFCKEIISDLPALEVHSLTQALARLTIFPWVKIGIWIATVQFVVSHFACPE